MADSSPYTKPHFPISKLDSRIQPKQIKQGKSCSAFLFKSLFLALFLVALPLFPSKAPDFVSQTILTKFWELLHLLVIGIAVAYGLFSRRNPELETNIETHPSSAVDNNNNNNNTTSYVSTMFPASTIFGDGCENNPCGFDEKRMMMMHCWNPQYIDGIGGSGVGGTVGVFDEQYKTQLPVCENGFVGTNVVQAWNSEYYHSDPVVVVAQPYYGGAAGEPDEVVVGHKPLGLPVRSLKSVARDVDGPKYTNESDSSSGSRGSSRSFDKNKDREFGEMGTSNLEKNFDAVAVGGSASPIPWHSRCRPMEREVERYGNVTRPLHFRPLSVDETKFEAFGGSGSLQSTTSFSSHTSMYSSLDSVSSDNVDFQEEEMRQKEASYVPPASEKMNFQEKDMGRRKTSYVPAPENMIFQEEDMEQRKTSHVPAASENTNLLKRDLGKKISKGPSLRNRRMAATRGKYADVSHSSHFRPMSVDETQFESLGLQSFQSMGYFPSHMRMHSSLDSIPSDNMDFQEEEGMGQKKTFPMHTSENMNFQEEDMEEHKKKTIYVHAASENVNFQEVEDLGQKKTSFVPASENMNFQEVDLVNKISQVSSRNGMMETRGKYAAVSQPSHFRPTSVDETQLESLSSRSFQSMGSYSSQTSVRSSVDSVASENMNSLQESLGEKKKSSHGGSSSSSPSPSSRRNGETSLQPFQGRGYDIDSFLQDDLKNGLNDDDLKGISGIGGEDPPGNKESSLHALHSDSDKPASLARILSRGKSVRTRRASGITSGTMKIGEVSIVKKPNNVDAVMRKDKMKSGEPDILLKGISRKTMDSYCSKPEAAFSNRRKRDKLEPSKNVCKEDSDIKLENIQGSSDEEDGVSEYVNDSGLDSEVDKKASEFIAKFKAQIRLQKSGSIERSKGQKIIGNTGDL